MARRSLRATLVVLTVLVCCAEDKDAADSAEATSNTQSSDLWGRSGELWTATSRLPDVSFAGYQRGEQAILYLKNRHAGEA